MIITPIYSQIFGRLESASTANDDLDEFGIDDEGIESSPDEEDDTAVTPPERKAALEPEPSKPKQDGDSPSSSSDTSDSFERVEPIKNPTRDSSPKSPASSKLESSPKSPSSPSGTDDSSSSSPCHTSDSYEKVELAEHGSDVETVGGGGLRRYVDGSASLKKLKYVCYRIIFAC